MPRSWLCEGLEEEWPRKREGRAPVAHLRNRKKASVPSVWQSIKDVRAVSKIRPWRASSLGYILR